LGTTTLIELDIEILTNIPFGQSPIVRGSLAGPASGESIPASIALRDTDSSL